MAPPLRRTAIGRRQPEISSDSPGQRGALGDHPGETYAVTYRAPECCPYTTADEEDRFLREGGTGGVALRLRRRPLG